MASQVLGWVGTDGDGLAGLEYARDSIAARQRRRAADRQGRALGERDRAAGDQARAARQGPAPDARRRAAEQGRGRPRRSSAARGGPKGATALVMDPYSNTILALANWPRVDANDRAGAPDYAAQNRAVGFNYEPGSTFKAFTIAGRARGQRRRARRTCSTCRRRSTSPTARSRRPSARGGGRPHDGPDPRPVQQRRDGPHRPAARRDELRRLGAALRLRPPDRRRAARRGVRPGAQARGLLRLVDGQPADRPGRVGHAAAARDGVRGDRQRRDPAHAADHLRGRRPAHARRRPARA